jgi:hypothetical protein
MTDGASVYIASIPFDIEDYQERPSSFTDADRGWSSMMATSTASGDAESIA